MQGARGGGGGGAGGGDAGATGFMRPPPPALRPSANRPQVPGSQLTSADIGPGLRGRHAELFWPGDSTSGQAWYLIEIQVGCICYGSHLENAKITQYRSLGGILRTICD